MGKVSIRKTKNHSNTLIVTDGDKEIRLHSAYDPEKEAERSVSTFNKGRSSIIIISGLALAYHVHEIKKKYTDVTIVVLEESLEVIKLCKKNNLKNLDDVFIINKKFDLEKIFEEIDMAEFKGISNYIHRPSYQLNKEFYDSMLQDINQYISSKVSDLLTRFEFEEKWVENIFANIPFVFQSHTIKNLFGKFKNYPGIIVSAGPSLKKNVQLLNSIKDRALIICVDTALKVLLKYNVIPHIVMTLDAQKHSIKHFLGLPNHDAILLADLVSCPHVVKHYAGDKIFSTTSKYYTDSKGEFKRETTPLMDWIEKYSDNIGDIQSGGSVATSVFDLLLNLGCNQIILLGQDLAYTGREIHCNGTHHNEQWIAMINRFVNLDTINQNVVRKRKIKYIESFGGKDKVIADFVFDLYRSWFEDSSSKVAVKVINATEGGARIKNTKEMKLSELVNTLEKKKVSPGEILEKFKLSKNSDNANNLHFALEEAIEFIQNLKEIALNDDASNVNNIFEMAENEKIRLIMNPYLRRIKTYISRHEIGQEKARKLLVQEIKVSAEKLVPILSSCAERIKVFV